MFTHERESERVRQMERKGQEIVKEREGEK